MSEDQSRGDEKAELPDSRTVVVYSDGRHYIARDAEIDACAAYAFNTQGYDPEDQPAEFWHAIEEYLERHGKRLNPALEDKPLKEVTNGGSDG